MLDKPKGYAELYSFRLYSFGVSRLFFAGVMLFTIGTVVLQLISLGGNILTNNFSFIDFIVTAVNALPIIGLWLLYTACKQASSKKALSALSFFRASAIIGIIAVGLLILWVFRFFSLFRMFGMTGFLLLTLVILGLLIALYFVPVLTMTRSIREGIKYNTFAPIRGLAPFLIMIIISFALLVLGIILLAVDMASLNAYFGVFDGINLAFTVGFIIGFLLGLSSSVGLAFCLVVLWRFDCSLRLNPPPPPPPPQPPHFPPLPQ